MQVQVTVMIQGRLNRKEGSREGDMGRRTRAGKGQERGVEWSGGRGVGMGRWGAGKGETGRVRVGGGNGEWEMGRGA